MKITREIEKLHRESIIFDGLLVRGNLDSLKAPVDLIDENLAGGTYTVANDTHDFMAAVANILECRKAIPILGVQ